MKKFVAVVGLLAMSSSLWAACFGPFCWDDKGAYVVGSLENGNGDALPQKTKAQTVADAPDVKGQMVFCTDCVAFNDGKGMPCVSTGTAAGAYIAISTGAALTQCK